MRLSRLAQGFAVVPAGADPEISSITEDSRRVSPGALFVAVPGTVQDGHRFLGEALARGARAVVVERTVQDLPVPQVRAASAREALADLAARFHGFPARSLLLIGFTGTFGKTSTSDILRALLEAGGVHTGVLGSLGARYGSLRLETGPLTTPAPVELHGALVRLASAGATAVVMEVTSHALVLQRVRGLAFGGGLVAAVMPGEHTDFHRSYDDYVAAKARLIGHLQPGAILAYDADNRTARTIAASRGDLSPVGMSVDGPRADLLLRDVVLDASGAAFSIAGPLARGRDLRLRSALLGRGHLRNAALALTYALAHGVDAAAAREVLAGLQPLRRRMERTLVRGRTVLDDTAAHPDSFHATFDVVDLLPRGRSVVLHALRGRRGADINRRNAAALAELAARHGIDAIILTAAHDATADKDRVEPGEIDAACGELIRRGGRFVWHDTLAAGAADAMSRTQPGDLILLLGAQGMDRGGEVLRQAS